MVLWHGRSFEEMCGAILWVSKQDDSTTLQSIYSMHRWPPLWRGRIEICRKIVTNTCSQIVLKCWNLARIGRPDIPWSVNKLARSCQSGPKPVTNAWIDWEHTFIKHVNANNIVMWVTLQNMQNGLFQDSDFAEDLEDSKIYFWWNIMPFWKSYICSNQLDV